MRLGTSQPSPDCRAMAESELLPLRIVCAGLSLLLFGAVALAAGSYELLAVAAAPPLGLELGLRWR